MLLTHNSIGSSKFFILKTPVDECIYLVGMLKALAIYETARKIEDEIMESGIGLWKYGRGIFSNKPCYMTYKALME